MEFITRKPNRLKSYSYSTAGYYFLTLCTQNKSKMFWKTGELCDGKPQLSEYGIIVEKKLNEIPGHYPCVCIDKYVVMPNHVHLILVLTESENNGGMPAVPKIIAQFKGAVSKEIGISVWQKGFHDHVIRGLSDYQAIWDYIELNPSKWTDDCYFE